MRFGENRVLALFQIRKKGAPVCSYGTWVFLKTLIEVFNVGRIRAVQKRGPCKCLVKVFPSHCNDLSSVKADCAAPPVRLRLRRADQPFITSTSVLPSAAGEGETVIPADFIASILSPAEPFPPAMMAPA